MSTQEPTTALEPRSAGGVETPITGGEMDTLFRLANGLSQSGFFKDARQAQQAFAKLIFGRDLGLSATQAMTDVYIVEGKPEMSANLQASKVKASGKYDYRILEHDDTRCSIEFGPSPAPMKDKEGNWLPWPGALGVSTFTDADATKAGLAGKDNHKKYPRNMNFARSMSNGVAWFCPDVMNGIRVYAEGEIAGGAPVRVQSSVDGPEGAVEGIVEPEVDKPLSDEERQKLGELIDAAGLDDNELQMHLTAVGVDCTDDLTLRTAEELRALIDRSAE